jgi:hypothetical protein
MEDWTWTPHKLAGGLAIIGLLVIAILAVAPGGSQAQQGPDDLKAPEADPGLDVLACYVITSGISAQPPLNARMVTDNYGGDVVNIFGSRSPFFCESAVKNRIGDTATLPFGKLGNFVFQCFDVERGANPDDDLSLVTHNFGTEPVIVGQAIQMCESAQKVFGGDKLGRPGRMALHCFAVEPVPDADGAIPVHGAVSLTTDNFGPRVVELGDTSLMCEEASKHSADPNKPDVGRPTGRVWQCIDANERDPAQINPSVKLTTSNFGEVEVGAGRLVMMCEKAKKVYSLTFTPVRP